MSYFQNNFRNSLGRPGAVMFYIFAGILFALGVVGAFEPLESIPQVVRDKLRMSPASGEVVLVAIDNKSLALVQPYPWPRTSFATIVDRLDKAGANKIVFDHDLSNETNLEDDDILADTFNASKADIFLQHQFSSDGNDTHADFFPLPKFTDNAELMNSNVLVEYNGNVLVAPYGVKVQGNSIPSLASVVSENYNRENSFFPIDYGIDIDTIPVISAVDILDGRWSPKSVEGKTVVFAGTASKIFAKKITPGNGATAKSIINILAAETLIRGKPIVLGFIPFFILAIVLGGFYIMSTERENARRAIFVFFGSAIALPFVYEPLAISADIMPAVVMILAAGLIRLSIRIKNQISDSGRVDIISGMPNAAALNERTDIGTGSVAAMLISNMPDLEYAVKDDIGRCYETIGKVININGGEAYHGGYGIVIGVFDHLHDHKLEESIEGMNAVLRTIKIDERILDIVSSWGIDDNLEIPVADRARRAVIAAREAKTEDEVLLRFNEGSGKEVAESVSLSSETDIAIDNREAEMFFQPKIRLLDDTVVGGEMLFRLFTEEKGLVNTGELILHAEKYGRIWEITKFSLNETAMFISKLGPKGRNLTLSVNISAKLLNQANLPDKILSIIRDHGVSPEQLMLEVTETADIVRGDTAIRVMERLKNSGFALSIDDYGTGKSTLEYLKKVPATEIKIDRSFIDTMEESRSDEIMVRSTIQLAESLGMNVIAEGIERQSTVDKLIEMGCYGGQGYFFAKPMNLTEAEAFIFQQPRLRAIG